MPYLNGCWKYRDELYYEDLVHIEAPFFAGKPPKEKIYPPGLSEYITRHRTERDMYFLKDKPFKPVARWETDESDPNKPKIVYCGGFDVSLQFNMQWLIRTARRRYDRGGIGGSPDIVRSPKQDSHKSRADMPAAQAIDNTAIWPGAPSAESLPAAHVSAGIKTGLGDTADVIAAKSPTMQQLQTLTDKKWVVLYNKPGLASATDSESSRIFIGDAYRTRPEWAASQLSHELGHAEHPPVYDFSSKEAYLQSEQLSEGYATLSNIRAQREILMNDGPKIPLSVNPDNIGKYNDIYDQAAKSGDWKSAASAIGNIFGEGEKSINPSTGELESYNKIYGDYYDATYGKGR
ncbi:hypothetical protein [Dyella caseinilytica]|uniref:Uncharacterized protein n=1 Tax=Dyella caseinilytica TaxID=1849581 RepID=A0ABX7GQH5_9GAMM|nr:hypothetical protein [Dyella caseinilytica]QRN52611.1 hypothetical protein ISN74_14200 [Dyella caseinilytica]GGA07375.1 hypothetical protein GCM10011408_30690 [Dyella caseinilytica]